MLFAGSTGSHPRRVVGTSEFDIVQASRLDAIVADRIALLTKHDAV